MNSDFELSKITGRETPIENDSDIIACPFCGESDFNLIGLKCHLLRHCKEFENTEYVIHKENEL
jgi:hypothetical protein